MSFKRRIQHLSIFNYLQVPLVNGITVNQHRRHIKILENRRLIGEKPRTLRW